MNRIVGAKYEDALKKRLKVDAVKEHLNDVNPFAKIKVFPVKVSDENCLEELRSCDWILMCTDNHSSRIIVQELCFKYYIPFIACGVNITSENGDITDMSGEVITIRPGDKVCLNCLGRVDYTKLAHESHPDDEVREKLVQRGYVSGVYVPEPAVKTLNTYLATLAVDNLVNQYTGLHRHSIVTVFEYNDRPHIYEDEMSLKFAKRDCFICG
jgi:molybdopterin/thiamine biosynthesis adenylyltransferase